MAFQRVSRDQQPLTCLAGFCGLRQGDYHLLPIHHFVVQCLVSGIECLSCQSPVHFSQSEHDKILLFHVKKREKKHDIHVFHTVLLVLSISIIISYSEWTDINIINECAPIHILIINGRVPLHILIINECAPLCILVINECVPVHILISISNKCVSLCILIINDCAPLHVLIINECAPWHILKVLFRIFPLIIMIQNELRSSLVDCSHLNSTSHCSSTWVPVGKLVRKEVGQRAELGALCCPRHCRTRWTAVGTLMPAHWAIPSFCYCNFSKSAYSLHRVISHLSCSVLLINSGLANDG